MSDEVLNSNPTVLEEWQLPQRSEEVKEKSTDVKTLEQFSLARYAFPELNDNLHDLSDPELTSDSDSEGVDPIDAQEIFDLIVNVQDPEHPLTLGQLAVVALERIKVTDSGNPDEIAEVHVEITPTVTHCSLATLIGLGLRVRLERSLPPKFRIKITVTPGSHQSEHQVNKQLNDKERVAAACENEQLLKVIGDMLVNC